MLGNVPNGERFTARQASGGAIVGSAWEPGPRSQAAALGLAEKPAFDCPEAAGPAAVVRPSKKILPGLLTFGIYVYIFIYTGAMLRPENKRGPSWIIQTK